jgi:putative sterol carrier protein
MSPEVWFAVATGKLAWADALATGQISASGVRADLSQVLPLARS